MVFKIQDIFEIQKAGYLVPDFLVNFDDKNGTVFPECYLETFKKVCSRNKEIFDEALVKEIYNNARIALRRVPLPHITAPDYLSTAEAKFKEQLKKELLKTNIKIENPVFPAVNQIDQQIKELTSWNPLKLSFWKSLFQRSQKDKVTALEQLKDKLLTADDKGDIGKIISYHYLDNKQIFAKPRNFWVKEANLDYQDETYQFLENLGMQYDYVKVQRSAISNTTKQKIIQPFLDYIESRSSWLQQLFTRLFRNEELSQDKLNDSKAVVEKVIAFQYSYENLQKKLGKWQNSHAEDSIKAGKNHPNLLPVTHSLLSSSQSVSQSDSLAESKEQEKQMPTDNKHTHGFFSTNSHLAEAFRRALAVKEEGASSSSGSDYSPV